MASFQKLKDVFDTPDLKNAQEKLAKANEAYAIKLKEFAEATKEKLKDATTPEEKKQVKADALKELSSLKKTLIKPQKAVEDASTSGFGKALSKVQGGATKDLKPGQQDPLTTALIGVLGATVAAFAAVIVAVLTFTDIAKSLVEALNPGLIEVFNRALADLSATLGVAFQGIFNQGIDFFEHLAGIVLPLFTALKPVIDQLSGTIFEALITIVQALIGTFEAFVPILKLLSGVFELVVSIINPIVSALGAILTALLVPFTVLFTLIEAVVGPVIKLLATSLNGISKVFQTVTQLILAFTDTFDGVIQAFIGAGLGDILAQIAQGFTDFLKSVIETAKALARLIPLIGERLASNIDKRFNAVGEKAAGQTSIKTLDQIGKDLAVASVNAGGGDPTGRIVDANTSNTDRIITALKDLVPKVPAAADVLKGSSEFLFNSILDDILPKPLGFGVKKAASLFEGVF